jgi:hypothetical protein
MVPRLKVRRSYVKFKTQPITTSLHVHAGRLCPPWEAEHPGTRGGPARSCFVSLRIPCGLRSKGAYANLVLSMQSFLKPAGYGED